MVIQKSQRTRTGFTLPELLVATALVVLLMSIIADAFSQSLQSFRLLKSTGDLQDKLRTGVTTLRTDLLAHHFDQDQKLSDPWSNGTRTDLPQVITNNPPIPPSLGTVPPAEGFFMIHGGPATEPGGPRQQPVSEGQDVEGIRSSRGYQAMHFTVNLRGRRPEDYFRAQVPNIPTQTVSGGQRFLAQHGPAAYRESGVMVSQWATVAYFWVPAVDPAGLQRRVGTKPLLSLHRRVRLLVNDSTAWGVVPDNATNRNAFANVAYWSDGMGNLHFHDSKTIQNPALRPDAMFFVPTGFDGLGVAGGNQDVNRLGDDLLIADVLAFQVEILAPSQLNFQDVRTRPASHAFAQNPPPKYDTHDFTTTDSTNQRVRAIRITIRVWDFKLEQARQVSIIQDM